MLSGDGSKAFLFGGADVTLTTVMGDGWELDLDACSWQQVFSMSEGE